jgi:hypothetical protein
VVKRGLVCNLEPPERPDDEEYEHLKSVPYETETDDDYFGPSSKTPSRRSSCNTTSGSLRSDGDFGTGDFYGRGKYSDGTDGMDYFSYSPGTMRRMIGGETTPRGLDPRMQPAGEELVSIAGRMQISASYAPTANKLAVSILKAEDLPTKERGGPSMVQVRVVLLPPKKQRFKTKPKSSNNASFHETFTFSHVTQEEIRYGSLRIRVYGHERITRDRLVGEVNMPLSEFDLESESDTVWRMIIPRSQLSVSVLRLLFKCSQQIFHNFVTLFCSNAGCRFSLRCLRLNEHWIRSRGFCVITSRSAWWDTRVAGRTVLSISDWEIDSRNSQSKQSAHACHATRSR